MSGPRSRSASTIASSRCTPANCGAKRRGSISRRAAAAPSSALPLLASAGARISTTASTAVAHLPPTNRMPCHTHADLLPPVPSPRHHPMRGVLLGLVSLATRWPVRVQDDGVVEDLGGQVPQRCRLVGGEAGGPHLLAGQRGAPPPARPPSRAVMSLPWIATTARPASGKPWPGPASRRFPAAGSLQRTRRARSPPGCPRPAVQAPPPRAG
jgi:hypothetical protein